MSANTTVSSFWERVTRGRDNDCWNWIAGVNNKRKACKSYGRFRFAGTKVLAHRFSWQLSFGVIPADKCVLHHCDNPRCVNPRHLFLGTYTDNNKDRDAKGRHIALHGSKHGHAKLTEEQVSLIRQRYNAGKVSYQDLANEYGVTKGAIHSILKYQGWRHVP